MQLKYNMINNISILGTKCEGTKNLYYNQCVEKLIYFYIYTANVKYFSVVVLVAIIYKIMYVNNVIVLVRNVQALLIQIV